MTDDCNNQQAQQRAMRTEAIQMIEFFLISRGFSAAEYQEGKHDGHWMLQTLPLLIDACCPASFEAGLRHALELLEKGSYYDGTPLIRGHSDWSDADSAVVLRRVGLLET